MSETAYWTKEVAGILNVGVSTVRKYAKILEEHGHTFHRNQQNQRGFFDSDIELMSHMIELMNKQGLTLETAAKQTIREYGSEDPPKREPAESQGSSPSLPAVNDDQIRELVESNQEQFNQLVQAFKAMHSEIQEVKRTNEQLSSALEEAEKSNQSAIQAYKSLEEEVINQREYIDNSIRSRDEELTKTMRSMIENRERKQPEERKKRNWLQFLNPKQ